MRWRAAGTRRRAHRGRPEATTAARNPSASASPYDRAVAYAKCMRSHGITDMPDPDNSGNFDLKALHPAGGSDLNPGDPRYAAANTTCRYLLPNGGRVTPAARQHDQAQALLWAHCMRAHGLANFPDPASNGLIGIQSIRSAGLAPTSPQFQAADRACGAYQPDNVGISAAGGGQ